MNHLISQVPNTIAQYHPYNNISFGKKKKCLLRIEGGEMYMEVGRVESES